MKSYLDDLNKLYIENVNINTVQAKTEDSEEMVTWTPETIKIAAKGILADIGPEYKDVADDLCRCQTPEDVQKFLQRQQMSEGYLKYCYQSAKPALEKKSTPWLDTL
jgi:predicted transcriptional regulator